MKAWLNKSLVIAAASALLLSGCGTGKSKGDSANAQPAAASDKKLKVVTTFYPMYEFSKQVGGHAEVIALVPAGSEPHDFEPSAKDMAKIDR